MEMYSRYLASVSGTHRSQLKHGHAVNQPGEAEGNRNENPNT